ncbi:zinc finger ccch domain-containing protein [Gigaspora margarita]|uniref:Zinc finger ccch domain-containing protein n=1 Tax=Gigaspora margarita TaxID=4874 RepID=A0A8H4A5D8_GIGMA|nr:zinc finger ccch domain-containing protein [Gigaspora margarita]
MPITWYFHRRYILKFKTFSVHSRMAYLNGQRNTADYIQVRHNQMIHRDVIKRRPAPSPTSQASRKLPLLKSKHRTIFPLAKAPFKTQNTNTLLKSKFKYISPHKMKNKSDKYCEYYLKYGLCKYKNSCRNKHDPARVAVCKDWLKDGTCKLNDKCHRQHILSPHVVPHCCHFQYGYCYNPECRYIHVHVNDNAPLCRAFVQDKYCEQGLDCKNKHNWSRFNTTRLSDDNSTTDTKDSGKRSRENDETIVERATKHRLNDKGKKVDEFAAGFDYIPFNN